MLRDRPRLLRQVPETLVQLARQANDAACAGQDDDCMRLPAPPQVAHHARSVGSGLIDRSFIFSRRIFRNSRGIFRHLAHRASSGVEELLLLGANTEIEVGWFWQGACWKRWCSAAQPGRVNDGTKGFARLRHRLVAAHVAMSVFVARQWEGTAPPLKRSANCPRSARRRDQLWFLLSIPSSLLVAAFWWGITRRLVDISPARRRRFDGRPRSPRPRLASDASP